MSAPVATPAAASAPRAGRRRRPVEHARRGVRLQVALRGVLVVFVALTVLVVPPAHDRATCAAVAVGYALWPRSAVALWTRATAAVAVARWAWLALFVDLAVLGVLTLLTGVATPQSWTADVLTTGFLLVPVLAAATQLRPRVCAAVVVPDRAGLPRRRGIATQSANAEPWASLLLRTLVMAGVGAALRGAVVDPALAGGTIGRLVRARTGAARRADRAGAARAAGAVRAAARRRAAVRAGRPPGPRRGPRHRRPGGVRPAGAGARGVVAAAALDGRRAAPGRAGARRAARRAARPRRVGRGPRRVRRRRSTRRLAGRANARRPTGCSTGRPRELLGNVVKHAAGHARRPSTLALARRARPGSWSPTTAWGARPPTAAHGSARATSGWPRTRCGSRRRAGGSRRRPNPPHGTVVTVELPVGRSGDTAVVPHIDRQADGVDGRATAS